MSEYIFLINGIHCAGCVNRVSEYFKQNHPQISFNLSLIDHKLTIQKPDNLDKQAFINLVSEPIKNLGYEAILLSPHETNQNASNESRRKIWLRYLIAIAITGFASTNIMLLSSAVWAGAQGTTRDYLHLISGIIAIPAIFYGGKPIFQSAYFGIKNRQLNMDFPIALAILLAVGFSVYSSMAHLAYAWFDGAVMLVFFLNIGRFLNFIMEDKSQKMANQFAQFQSPIIHKWQDNQEIDTDINAIKSDDLFIVKAGEFLSLDAKMVGGHGVLDTSFISGESDNFTPKLGDALLAGSKLTHGEIIFQAITDAQNSMVQRIARKITQTSDYGVAKQYQYKFIKIFTDIYVPLVHIIAILSAAFWYYQTQSWQFAVMNAITILIVTCPCAISLAIPLTQAITGFHLLRNAMALKSGAVISKFNEITMIIFDKTGTLTMGKHENGEEILRQDAEASIKILQAMGFKIAILSGDKHEKIAKIANILNISQFTGELTPMDKARIINEYQTNGEKILMIGDGFNDAPALQSAFISMAPADSLSAQLYTSDILFMGQSLLAVPKLIKIAKKSSQITSQNLLIGAIYNAIAIPLAISGIMSPFLAVIAMSSSSLLVSINAWRCNKG